MKSKKELRHLFNKIRDLTNNFGDIKKEVLIKIPDSTLTFRHFLGVSQKDFSKLIGISKNYLADLERKKSNISNKLAYRVSKNIKEILIKMDKNKISFENFYKNYKKFKSLNKLTSKRAKEIRKLRKNYPQSIPVSTQDVIKRWKSALNTEKLANIVGVLNGDGHLQLDTKNYRYLISFYSNNVEEINNFKSTIEKIFGINGRIYLDKRGKNIKYKLFFISKGLCLFLNSCGVIIGKKTKKEFLVPDWILYGKDKIKSAFIKGLFDTEGYVSFHEGRWRIGISQNKEEYLKRNGYDYMNQIKDLVESFGIHCSGISCFPNHKIRKDGSKTTCFQFTFEKRHFRNFYKYIGFDNKNKQRRLINALDGSVAKINMY